MQGKAVYTEIRLNHPEQVDRAHEKNDAGDKHHGPPVPLQASRQQHEQRQEKLKDNQQKTDPSPGSIEARRVPDDLVRKVAAPDNEELRKGEVGPQHQKRKQQLAQL